MTPPSPLARGPVGRSLDHLYDATAALGAVAMIVLLAMVLLSVVSRQVGFNVGGIDAYAGYMMAAAGFLAMAHTLKRGEHIRVTLLLAALKGRSRHALEIWALFAATLLALLSAIYSCKLAWQSYTFHDISTSNDATPLWLPQLSMALGAVVLAIAFIDELVLEIRGRRVVPVSDEATRNE
jgi:TRAP-type C4-dicarboxylate transport system permease small subunit